MKRTGNSAVLARLAAKLFLNRYYEAEVLKDLGEANPYKGVAIQHFLLENRKHTYVDRSSMETKPVNYAQQRLDQKHKKFNNWVRLFCGSPVVTNRL